MKNCTAFLAGAIFVLAPLASFAQSSPEPMPTSSAAPGEQATVAVPTGWVAKPFNMNMGTFIIDHMWMSNDPKAVGDNINLGYAEITKGDSLDTLVATTKAQYAKLAGPGGLIASHAEKLCNGTTDGWYFELNFTMGTIHLVSEQTMLLGKTRTFGATYTRKTGEPEDPAARKALDSLCTQ